MKKEKQSWTDYVPHSVSLYYVDYRENLDSHDDLQEQCIRRNSLGPLEEQILEWYADQEHDNLQGSYPVLDKEDKDGIYPHTLSFSVVETRYVRIIARVTPKLPAWHMWPGNPTFLFVDEVCVK